jgi:hypothetical protein
MRRQMHRFDSQHEVMHESGEGEMVKDEKKDTIGYSQFKLMITYNIFIFLLSFLTFYCYSNHKQSDVH